MLLLLVESQRGYGYEKYLVSLKLSKAGKSIHQFLRGGIFK